MHFGLTHEQEMIVETVRKFVEQEMYPSRMSWNVLGSCRWKSVRKYSARSSTSASTLRTCRRSSEAAASIT